MYDRSKRPASQSFQTLQLGGADSEVADLRLENTETNILGITHYFVSYQGTENAHISIGQGFVDTPL